MAGRVQQLLAVMLAVDVQQLPPQLPQLGHRHQLSVDAAHVPPVSLELPLEEQLLLPGGEAVLLQPGQGGHLGEHRRHQGGLGPGADELPAGALPQHRADGVDDDGFARPRLAGEHVEARLEPNVRRLDEGDIFNVKQGKQSCTPPLSRSLQKLVDLLVEALRRVVVPHDEDARVVSGQAAHHAWDLHAVQGGAGRRGQSGHGPHHHDVLGPVH